MGTKLCLDSRTTYGRTKGVSNGDAHFSPAEPSFPPLDKLQIAAMPGGATAPYTSVPGSF